MILPRGVHDIYKHKKKQHQHVRKLVVYDVNKMITNKSTQFFFTEWKRNLQ